MGRRIGLFPSLGLSVGVKLESSKESHIYPQGKHKQQCMIEDEEPNKVHEWVSLYIPEFFLCRRVDSKVIDLPWQNLLIDHLPFYYLHGHVVGCSKVAAGGTVISWHK